MLLALVNLREAYTEVAITEDEDEIDFEESGFQATYTKLIVAASPNVDVVPINTVDDAIKNFVARFVAVNVSMQGNLLRKAKNELCYPVFRSVGGIYSNPSCLKTIFSASTAPAFGGGVT